MSVLRMALWGVAGGVGALGLGLGLGASMMDDREAYDVPDVPGDWRAFVRASMAPVAQAAGVPDLVHMAVLQASSESRGQTLVGLGVPSRFPPWARPNLKASASLQANESKAAEIGYDRYAATMAESPYPRERWVFGSGGLYGLLPSSGLGFARRYGHLESPEIDPWDVFDPHRASTMFASYIRGVTQTSQWKALPDVEKNWLAVKRAGASLNVLADWEAKGERAQAIHRNIAKRVASAGLPAGWERRRVPSFASTWDTWKVYNAVPRAVPSGPGRT